MSTSLAVRPQILETEPKRPTLEIVDQAYESISNGVTFVSELPGDSEIVAQAERRLKFRLVGGQALEQTVECNDKPITDIREGIIWASRGDEEGVDMVDANVRTEMIEQVYKAGNVIKINLDVDENDIYQHGQRMTAVANNAYHLASDDPIIKPRTIAEAKNIPRMKRLFDEGILEDNVFLRLSMCAEGVSDEKLDKLKFFSATKSMSVQMAYSENGQLVDEVAMVAGVAEPGAERHDRSMAEGIAEHFDKSYEGMSSAEILENGLLIPKEYVENGVVDIVRIMDDINGGTFFGQDIPDQDGSEQGYIDYAEFCERRAARFNRDIEEVRNQLIAEADKFMRPVVASQRLAKLVEQRMVDKALTDKSIDPTVFGSKSAENLIQARQLRAQGNHHEAQAFMQVALATAQGGSCPSALNNDLLKALGLPVNGNENERSSHDHDDLGSRYFPCTNGHKNYRRKENVKETKCQTEGCNGSVGC